MIILNGKRAYLQPMAMIYNALIDVAELQKGEKILDDPTRGRLHFRIEMYGFTWELRFSVLEIDWNRCGVALEVEEKKANGDSDGDTRYLEDMIRREYALLDSILLIGTPFETVYGDAT